MEFGHIQAIISNAIEQTKADQLVPLINWLDAEISRYRHAHLLSTSVQSVLTPKINHDQRFTCACGRSFAAEISIRETTHVEQGSPPATPMLSLKTDPKHQQQQQQQQPQQHHHHSHESLSKRPRTFVSDQSTSVIPTTVHDRMHSSVMTPTWPGGQLKTYDGSPELMVGESTHAESDLEISSDESHCLDEIGAVLSPDKSAVSNYIYANSLWANPLSPSTHGCVSYATDNHEHHREPNHYQMTALKPVSKEPLSPTLGSLPDGDSSKAVAAIHRRPLLVAITDQHDGSPSAQTHFKCTQCHETFDTLLLGQEHATNGLCTPDGSMNILENSDSHLSPSTPSLFDSLQENMEEVLSTRMDSKAACPICNKVFSSVHTMLRHKTSIHDRQVRYGCNICGRFFFRKDKLTSHMVYHQDFDTYVCCFCSLGCKSRMLMRQHLKRDHGISSEDTCFNEVLRRCQTKRSHNLDTNMSMAYTEPDGQSAPLKRNLHVLSAESDIKQTASN